MKKHLSIILGLILLVVFTNVNAQSKMHLGVGADISLPMGSFGDVAGLGFGGSVRGELGLADNINGMATVGYLTYGGKDFGNSSYSYSAIAILVGAKYYIGTDGLYTMAETGFHLWTYSVESQPVTIGGFTVGGGSNDFSASEFSYGVGVGYEFGSFDVNVKYTGAGSGISYIGARVGYRFAL